jgi:hypothetical protein
MESDSLKTLADLLPQQLAGVARAVVPFANHDIEAEIRRSWNPILLSKEEWLLQQDAADIRVFRGRDWGTSIKAKSCPYFLQGPGAIRVAKSLPRQTDGKRYEPRKKPATGNRVSPSIRV